MSSIPILSNVKPDAVYRYCWQIRPLKVGVDSRFDSLEYRLTRHFFEERDDHSPHATNCFCTAPTREWRSPTRPEFERRYAAAAAITKAELIEGIVYVASHCDLSNMLFPIPS